MEKCYHITLSLHNLVIEIKTLHHEGEILSQEKMSTFIQEKDKKKVYRLFDELISDVSTIIGNKD